MDQNTADQITRRLVQFKLLRACAWLQKLYLFGFDDSFSKGHTIIESLQRKSLVFVISFHRTGTRSCCQYAHSIGLKTIHWPVFSATHIYYQQITRSIIDDKQKVVRALAHLYCKYDFFADVPFGGLYKELDEVFPMAKFIFIQREASSWWTSVSHLWNLDHRQNWKLTTYEAIQYGLPVGYEVTPNQKEMFIEIYSNHADEVERHFIGKSNILFLDLLSYGKAKKISEFLEIEKVCEFPFVQ